MYLLTTFDTTTLPVYNYRSTVTSGTSVATAVNTAGGGVFSSLGSDETAELRLPYNLSYSADIVTGVAATARTQAEALLKLRGKTSYLYRRRVDDTGSVNLQRCKAHLQQVSIPDSAKGGYILTATMSFQIQSGWETVAATTATKALATGGGSTTLALNHSTGNREQTALVLTLQAGSAAITRFQIDLPATLCSWFWEGTLAAGDTLTIDCDKKSVLDAGQDSYDNFHLTSNHKVEPWLLLPAETTVTADLQWTDNSAGSAAAALSISFRQAFA